jgi:hypothetical protein
MNFRRAQPSEARAIVAWIKERHYLRTTPPGYVAPAGAGTRGSAAASP